ncbi:MAG: four helix bundle protein [Chloroflexota bacterium]|nr:four helix bundle protein [Chloroflexota bacterium]
MKIERFEDLKSWRKARQLANQVYDFTDHSDFRHDFRLRNQIQGAAGSVMHNLAEGFDAGSDKEFARFLKYARRSASEVQSQLYLALDRHYIAEDDLHIAYDLATEVKRLINGLIAYLHRSNRAQETAPDYLTNDYSTDDYSTNDHQTKDYPTNN